MNITEYERVWAEVELDRIAHNITQLRKFVDPRSVVMAVVKADGYGHGAVEVAKAALGNGAGALGVSICEEGVQLRENGIVAPILIFGYTPEARLCDVIRHDLTQTIYSGQMAKSLSRAAARLGKAARVHIKIDTGMSRLGFMPAPESVEELVSISKLPYIEITGIYTHFAESDACDKTFTYEQFARFETFTQALADAGVTGLLRHASNSGAILGCRELDLDMVRSGILLYGLSPSPEAGAEALGLKPAMSLKTRICHIKTIGENVSVSYSRAFTASRETRVATVPVGYADGYPRSMAKGGRVIVDGEYAPIIGNICMDMFMIDVSHIPNAQTGDEVVLIGSAGDRSITAADLAAVQGTLAYEVVCAIGKRVSRAYMQNNSLIKTVNFF